MENEQGLKTLRDYRKVARDSLYDLGIIPKNKSTSFYDAIKTALINIKNIIICSRSKVAIDCVWDAVILPNSKYEMRNLQLFHCIKLMEFAITYREVRAIDKLAQNWPKRPDVNAMVFTSAGISFLEASFNYVCKLGSSIILILQNAYKKYNREGNIIYRDPFKFLTKTPSVDDLKINPEPDIIIKTWFDSIIEEIQEDFPENEFSYNTIEAKFNSIQKQLEYEWNSWSSGKAGDKKKLKSLPKPFSFGEGQAFFSGKDLKLSTGETVDILKKLAGSLGNTVKHTELDSQSTNSNASDFLRGRIKAIKAALIKNKVPYKIRSMRGIGYVLEHT